MNLYDALNKGDGSIKEVHLTSIFYYILTNTYNQSYPSFLNFFLEEYLNLKLTQFEPLDVESDIQVEEQLYNLEKNPDLAKRKDTDITIYLKNSSQKLIVNIENKINSKSYDPVQIATQKHLLQQKNKEYEIINFLLLPFETDSIKSDQSANHIIYWHGNESSLIQQFVRYEEVINKTQNSIKPFIEFFIAFGDNLEQNKLAEGQVRVRNNYRYSMYEYLKQISDNWDNEFDNPNRVNVSQLLDVFDKKVVDDFLNNKDTTDEEKKISIARFRRGANHAQPKIMTVNEKNRLKGFGIKDSKKNALFYYPNKSFANVKWKDRIIKPLVKKNKDEEVYVLYEHPKTSEIISEKYNG
tara:strand:+ start:67 stop:1128 length:1062 start_codon:yes stop_codon:yes gene_type:complete